MNRLLLAVVLFFSGLSFAQFGNEWIQYNQQYYSFKIVQDGIYRLDYNLLASAGVPVSTIDPDDFAIFGFEKEQYIWVEDDGDATFEPGEFILLFAQKNNTWLDSLMYENPDDVSNKYYPHYNDTINYFLTWNSTGGNNRIQAETDVDFASYSPQPYFLRTTFSFGSTSYAEGFQISGMSYASYVEGEGWFGNKIYMASGTNYQDHFLSTTNAYTGGGAPNTKGIAVSTGSSNASYSGLGNHHLLLQYTPVNIVLYDTIFSGYQRNKLPIDLAPGTLTSPTTRFRHTLPNDLGVAADYQSVAYVEITYPHNMNLENSNYYRMRIPYNDDEGKTRYDFTSFNGPTPWAFTLNGQMKKIPVVNTSGTYQVLIPNNSNGLDEEFVLFDEAAIVDVATLTPVNGTGSFTDYSLIDFNGAYLIISHESLWTSANEYADYRSSVDGGNYNVILADIDELYLQFGGGVEKHVMGIRRFAHYAYNQSSIVPTNLFVIGKGVREANELIATGNGTRKSVASYNMCLVPSFGYPASDNLITAQLEGNLWAPLIPTGRLAASTDAEVIDYLNKVKEYELAQDPNSVYSVPEKLWQKEILHFGGGATATEQATFKSYLQIYENTLEGQNFGGNVTSYYKSVSDPIDPAVLYEVTDQINDGVSLMTFFGHASADGFDQNIDDPDTWDNKGKYPVVVGNACQTGNIHEPNNLSASEEYVLIGDKGAIAFLANVKQAFSANLHTYSREFFIQVSQNNYGGTIGQHIQYTIANVQSDPMSFGLQNVCTEMTLHGDPALRINPHESPELEVNQNSIFIEPYPVDLTTDSIDVNVIVYNLGMTTSDTFIVELTRTFPNNGGDSLYIQAMEGLYYLDTITFTIPFYNNVGVGINDFTVRVDIPSGVDEQYDEISNNQITKQVIFDVDGIYPVWPYNYAVVPKDTISVLGSTVNPFAGPASYRFEIDTTDLFNSPEHRYYSTVAPGGVVGVNYGDWLSVTSSNPDELILEDSMVYFWRVAVEDTGSFYWIEQSFQYIAGKSGWGQDHFFQFKNNEFNSLQYNRPLRVREFAETSKLIDCDVYGNASTWLEFAFTLFHIDGSLDPGYGEYNFCGTNPQLMVAVIDPCTLKSWGTRWVDSSAVPMEFYNMDHDFGNANDNAGCRNRVEDHFAFQQDNPVQMAALDNMIRNEIPDSFYVLIYTTRYANYSEWDTQYPAMYTLFSDIGSDSIYPGRPEVPFIVFFRKGDVSSTQEVYGQFLGDDIHFEDTLWGCDNYGIETSTLVGPAQFWETIYWKQDSLEGPNVDSTRLKVYGLTAGGSSSLMIDTLFTHNDSIINLNTLIDAGVYPYLQLQAELKDTVNLTPAQIDRWHVLYTPVPEAALDGAAGVYWIPSDTMFEGQQIAVAFDIRNISDLPMDSLLVHYWIEDAGHNLIPISYPRQDSLRVGETIRDTLVLPSVDLTGLNSLWVEVNPYVGPNTKDQPEMHHFNNMGQIPFYVIGDDENPILDVTFDGYHILDGDVVSPESEIIITLKDDNPYLIMNDEADTANFGIYLTAPDGVQKKLNFRNALGEPLMEWIPADANNLKFSIIYKGEFEQDGIYRLLVQGIDKTGNLSGDFEYDIEFEVDHQSSITNLMNYPNPFSTSTQFVFTLTGSVIPDEFTIQIMTVTGKVVREITVDELGPIKIGRNITEYTWDGTDEYGDLLANGVYLYRVIVKINGEDVEHRESGADQYFTKEFGKMYILR